jgi:CO/xanthine dehydrogenase Mo-binding subunit
LFGGPEVAHYHQAIACVVAETFEQARAAAALIRTRYERGKGRFDFPALAPSAPLAKGVTASPTGRRWAISTPPTRAPRSSSTRPITPPTKVIR